MSRVEISLNETSEGSLDRASKMLAGISGGMDKAVHAAMERATDHMRTISSRKIREVYAITDSNIRAAQNVKTRYSYKGRSLTAEVEFSGNKIPLYRYNGASPAAPTADTSRKINALLNGWVQVHPAVAAAGHQLKGTAPTRFDNAFVAKFSSGHIGIFERTGSMTNTGRDQLKELMGSSVPQMLGKEEVQESVVKAGMEKFEERLEQETTRIMNGWGG